MKRKGYIAEREVNQLLKRYETSTILSLLYEVSKCFSGRLDWNELVKETKTGIKNPREYQALWRHLAYRRELDPEGEDYPLEDDDSDLDFEVEPSPVVAFDTTTEASNYVKALMNDVAGDLPLQSVLPGFTNAQAASLEAFYKANSVSQADKKKRKVWSLQEDEELAASVEKYGEGNWAAMAKLVFKQERTAPQLAQRWAIVKKRREVAATSFPAKQSQVDSDALKRTKPALECEQNGAFMQSTLPKPAGQTSQPRLEKPNLSAAAQRKPAVPAIPRAIPLTPCSAAQAKAKPAIVPAPASASVQKPGASPAQASALTSSSPRSVKAGVGVCTTNSARTVPVPSGSGARGGLSGPDPMVQAAAVAAGARIAPASAAASFMKAKNVVHVRPPSSNSPKPTSSKPNGRGSPVVHYIRTGSGAPPPLLQALSGKRGKLGVKSSSAAGSKAGTSVKAAMSRLAVNSVKEEPGADAKPAGSKRKATPGGVMMQCQVSSWYEDDPGAFDGNLDSETEDHAPTSVGGFVCTSSNESFSQSAGGFTPNGASPPLSQSSGQSD